MAFAFRILDWIPFPDLPDGFIPIFHLYPEILENSSET